MAATRDKGKGRAAPADASANGSGISHGRHALVVDSDEDEATLSAAAAHATERTRLLADEQDHRTGSPASARSQRISARLRSSPSASIGESIGKRRRCRNVRWCRLILVLIIVILGLAVIALGAVYAILSSRLDGAQEMAQRGVRLQGPSDVRVLGLSDDGREVKLEVDMRAGIDSRAALDDETLPKWLVRWATRHVGAVRVALDGDVEVSDKHQTLVSIPGDSVPEITLPLNYGSLDPLYWLANLSIPVIVRVVAEPADLLDYANASYHAGQARVHVKVTSASAGIKLLGIPLSFGADDLTRALQLDIPQVDVGEPKDLVQLGSYGVHAEDGSLKLDARATGLNPLANGTTLERAHVPSQIIKILRKTRIDLPWSLRFVAALPPIVDETPALSIAHVDVQPVHLSSALQPLVRVKLNGTALPPPKDDDVPGTDAQLADFIGNYLDGRKSRVQVSYARTDAVPSFVAGLLASIPPVQLEIPGKTNSEPILDNVTIAHMRIGTTPDGENMGCSGIVRGHINLPAQFANLSSVLRISRVWPDVLVRCTMLLNQRTQVFDGPPEKSSKRIKHWPPETLPDRVFARLSPSDWLPAQTVVEEGQTWVVANMSDVAMKILPGRGAQFRSYLSKILLSGEDVETGIWGISNVKAGVQGFTSKDLELDNVPVSGSFFVNSGTVGRGLLGSLFL